MGWRPVRSIERFAASRTGRIDALCRHLVEAGVASDLHARTFDGGAPRPSVMVAVPATGEEDVLGGTLASLADTFHRTRRSCGLVVFANNCRDLTGEIVARTAATLPAKVVLLDGCLTEAHAHAGWARRIAMHAAAELCAPQGVILTTDADTHVAPDWVEALAGPLGDGVDLVCGKFTMASQAGVLARAPALRLRRAEAAYAALQDRVRHCCDQLIGRQPLGGMRPHYQEAGASIGLTRALHQRIGGLAPARASEDRALVRAAERAGARILYSARARVQTSNRLVGRARGGLAETLRRWLHDPDPLADQRLRPVAGIADMWSNALALATTCPHRLRRPFAAIRHAALEDECRRSTIEPRLRAADLERAIADLVAFVHDEVEPAFTRWRETYA